ncbi:MAG TPA: ABC transporter permease subunit [Candidatus Limnocylindrales bacterium]|nr:ABC transporter permease subunit [Candidatus Limnocylindrales bacterium]
MSTLASRLPFRGRMPLRGRRVPIPAGISAIVVKELRGRMRGRRAFIVVTIHVLLLAVFAWMLQRINEEQIRNFSSFGGQATYAGATVGRGIFLGLLMLQTLMVSVLAPAATAGAISSEREHQTLDLLAVTPISSFAIVLGKLFSALAWVFILILASIPVTALVFVYGGVAPDDVVRGYAVLFATVIGLGSIGIFFSALTRRTGASTGLTFVMTLVLVIGTFFLWVYFSTTGEVSATGVRRQPSEAVLYLNPFVAQADVLCGTEDGAFGGTCGLISSILNTPQPNVFPPGVEPAKPVPAQGVGIGGGIRIDPNDTSGVPFVGKGGDVVTDGTANTNEAVTVDSFRDRFWPKSVLSFLALAVVLTLLSVQYVTPTRRLRPSLPGFVRRLVRRRRAA